MDVVSFPVNAPFKGPSLNNEGEWLHIGIEHTPKNFGQLISFGRDPSCCDIILPEGSPKQCHFFIHPQSREVLLRDDSHDNSTVLFASSSPAEWRLNLPDVQPRQRVMLPVKRYASIRMRNALFRLGWSETIQHAHQAAQAMHVSTPAVALSSNPVDALENGQIFHQPIIQLGQGTSGKVFLTVNLKTGEHLAVKNFRFPPGNERKGKDIVRREVNLMKALSHVSFQPTRHLALL
jgi:hypothetical protein